MSRTLGLVGDTEYDAAMLLEPLLQGGSMLSKRPPQ